MPVCQSGHSSVSDDYCDVCGDLMEGAPRAEFAPSPPVGPPVSPSPSPSASSPVPAASASAASGTGASNGSGARESCPTCGAPRSGRFCEVDGYDFETRAQHTVQLPSEGFAVPPAPRAPSPASGPLGAPAEAYAAGPAPPGLWTALISADRAYYDAVVALGGPGAAAIAFPAHCPDRRVVLAGDRIRIGRRSNSRAILPEIDLSVAPEDPGVSHLHAVLTARPDGSWALTDPGSTNGTTVNDATEPIAVNVPIPLGDGDRVHLGAWTTITLSAQGETSS
ncbi:FHA domain-containing protein [Actinomadura xylanilytica]|uniref:FHA domain-containing protein n=1 Tax=Actinomadura xylanilytica TaxID=887459 RepID=UPI00255B07DB|nr:FHA domain-containing protein [Actinomadura xylanilytica]MDL4773674.1 FHA domain-containing protein [Actinomadura xylanilytica]